MESLKENIELKGSVHVKLIGPDGIIKQEHTNSNLVVTVGKTYLAAWLAANSQAGKFMSYVGLGTDQTGPASGDTALNVECSSGGYSRQVGVLTSLTNVWTNTCTFAPGNGTGAIKEAGLFTTVTSGTMFAHQTFDVYNKQAGDTLVAVWSVSFS
jgi:hypothetical protein